MSREPSIEFLNFAINEKEHILKETIKLFPDFTMDPVVPADPSSYNLTTSQLIHEILKELHRARTQLVETKMLKSQNKPTFEALTKDIIKKASNLEAKYTATKFSHSKEAYRIKKLEEEIACIDQEIDACSKVSGEELVKFHSFLIQMLEASQKQSV